MMPVDLLLIGVKAAIFLGIWLTLVPAMVLVERRLSAFMQDRLGPNRVGPFGIVQPIADALKFFFKEDVIPHHVDKALYLLAPAAILIPSLVTFSVIPLTEPFGFSLFGQDIHFKFQIADVSIGILFVFAVASLGVYGIVLGGWASNNKYSLLGGLRSSAQMISYEIAMGLAALSVLMMAGSLSIFDIIQMQIFNGETGKLFGVLPVSGWLIFHQPLAALIFIIAVFAETNRLPFDLPEAEQELVGGYHTEYGSMKFAAFFMAEYCNMVTGSALIIALFLGGWSTLFFDPWVAGLPVFFKIFVQFSVFMTKLIVVLFFFVVVRWTLPRFRYDQLMNLGWKVFFELALLNVVITAVVIGFMSVS
ncbi:MAG: NADH-quinone oxidoreductase subunit NuoH [Gemmatimonadetes bacterium]|nr:MAG: NADH-quinone oxidoreductase subunit NuoH [Gemmatimonadota bacterium]